MKHRVYSLDASVARDALEALAYRQYEEGEDDEAYFRALGVLERAIDYGLTDRERDFVRQYYFCGVTIPAIAAKLKVEKSSVSRTLKNAREKLLVLLFIGCGDDGRFSLPVDKIRKEERRKERAQRLCGA